jgi:glycosyltransferase involved in cell wall biosynthesis
MADGDPGTIVIVTTVAITHEAFLLPHAEVLRSAGHRVVGVARGLKRSASARVTYDAVHDIPLGRKAPIPDLFRSGAALRRIVDQERADAVWLHTPLASAVGRVALASRRRRGLLVAYMAHGFHFGSVSSSPMSRVYHAVEWSLSTVTDHLQTVNEEDYGRALGFPGRTPDNTVLTRGVGVDPERLLAHRDQRERSRRLLGLGLDDFAVFVVGDLNPEKRVADGLRAVAALGARARLFVVGDGPQRAGLEQLADSLGGRRARFLGFRRDLPVLLSAADVLIHPSSREGLPTVVLEAQALGVPVVGAAARGTADLLADGAGLTFPVGDVPALEAALRRLQADPEVHTCLVGHGLERVQQHRVDLATEASLQVSALLGSRRH